MANATKSNSASLPPCFRTRYGLYLFPGIAQGQRYPFRAIGIGATAATVSRTIAAWGSGFRYLAITVPDSLTDTLLFQLIHM
ncbi:MAG: hypothetical protein A3J97_15715 [Spirochaetes bacterium RIFOXYC1_FULL_54_7]|nr:MAG: hypothetical protein A3J97_15715 [Spirochaetes bacterium RIFOXYC1_FULL_54_7]